MRGYNTSTVSCLEKIYKFIKRRQEFKASVNSPDQTLHFKFQLLQNFFSLILVVSRAISEMKFLVFVLIFIPLAVSFHIKIIR